MHALVRLIGGTAIGVLSLAACSSPAHSPSPGRSAVPTDIIDMHFHAAWPGDEDAADLAARLEEMDANGIGLSTLFISSTDDMDKWIAAAPGRFIAGPMLPCPQLEEGRLFCFPESDGWPDVGWLEGELRAGRIGLIGELAFNYAGISPSDPRMEPYWKLAARYDVPVLVHTNNGPPPGKGPRRHPNCCPDFDGEMGNPALMRPVLKRFPTLRVVLQHSGFPHPAAPGGRTYWEETISLMRDYPNVYADMTVLNAVWDEESHRMGLKRFVDERLVDRIMFGSDNFPVDRIIARLHAIDFLTDAQRNGILHDNAARFLRLDEQR